MQPIISIAWSHVGGYLNVLKTLLRVQSSVQLQPI